MEQLSVLLADDHVPARVGIRQAIEPHGLRVVAEAASAAEAVHRALESRPQVAVVAVAMAGSGIEAARLIFRALPETKIVMTTTSVCEDEFFAALRAGAEGYVPMSTSAARLPYAIRGVVAGEAAIPRTLTARLIGEFRERGTPRRLALPAGGEAKLTAREFEVLARMRQHERTAQIAARLGISEVTVRRHVSSAVQKLGTRSRREAIELIERTEQAELQAGAPANDVINPRSQAEQQGKEVHGCAESSAM
ncbi:MAG: response regulator transcription factor [Solirubrobacterales bacterium]|nr:response regulator transcription factor [Solirubrobacterales bacterium]MBV9717326.1 response regulator transcription factor [Solirubrobacterales bacterium]